MEHYFRRSRTTGTQTPSLLHWMLVALEACDWNADCSTSEHGSTRRNIGITHGTGNLWVSRLNYASLDANYLTYEGGDAGGRGDLRPPLKSHIILSKLAVHERSSVTLSCLSLEMGCTNRLCL